MSVLLAGGGIRGGQTFGKSDRRAEYPENLPIGPEDIARTVYHAMGIENQQPQTMQDQPFEILGKGRPLVEIF